jgi:hypothetical protein
MEKNKKRNRKKINSIFNEEQLEMLKKLKEGMIKNPNNSSNTNKNKD